VAKYRLQTEYTTVASVDVGLDAAEAYQLAQNFRKRGVEFDCVRVTPLEKGGFRFTPCKTPTRPKKKKEAAR
jgi:hypothetical protein